MNLGYLEVISTGEKICTFKPSTIAWVFPAGYNQSKAEVGNLGIDYPAKPLGFELADTCPGTLRWGPCVPQCPLTPAS